MIDLLLDPERALDAIDKATKLVKRAMKTSSDVAGIGRALGAQMQARVAAEAALDAAQSGKLKGNAFQLAADLEMAIHKAKEDEEYLKNTVFYPNHIDLFLKIKATEAKIQAAQDEALRKAQIAAKHKADWDKYLEKVVIAVFSTLVVLGLIIWGIVEILIAYCAKKCGY